LASRQAEFGHDFRRKDLDAVPLSFLHYPSVISALSFRHSCAGRNPALLIAVTIFSWVSSFVIPIIVMIAGPGLNLSKKRNMMSISLPSLHGLLIA